jgi:GT2 family glycosyltransferase
MIDIELSIIILSYNTKQITLDAIESIERNYLKEVEEGKFELIVADNSSTDGSLQAFKDYKKESKIKIMHVVDNGGNIGFSAGNNKGVPYAKGRYVLFLNPDTIVYPRTLTYMLEFMDAHPTVGASSCTLINKDGALDFNCHRGFPSPWNSFCYFTGLQKLFPKSRWFAGYTQGWKDLKSNHEVDAIEGAFMLMPRFVGEKVGWWDEDYFFYGEDLQFSYDIRKLGYKIYYIGEVSIMHIGGAASGIKKKTQNITIANVGTKRKLQKARFEAMKIFYTKNYEKKYPALIKWIMFSGINYLEKKTLVGIKVT